MNIEKAKRILRKVQALVENMDEQGSASTLEHDLLRSYLRDLYEAVSQDTTDHASLSDLISKPEPVVIPEPVAETPAETKPATPVVESQPVIKDEPVAQETAEPLEESISPASTTSNEVSSEPVVDEVTEPQPMAPEEVTTSMDAESAISNLHSSSHPASLLSLFEDRNSGDLADKLQSQPIAAIQNEMGINERILTINELFGGDPEAFKQVVEHLNGLEGFSDAQQYLLNGPATQYLWSDDERAKKAKIFVQLVRRKYL